MQDSAPRRQHSSYFRQDLRSDQGSMKETFYKEPLCWAVNKTDSFLPSNRLNSYVGCLEVYFVLKIVPAKEMHKTYLIVSRREELSTYKPVAVFSALHFSFTLTAIIAHVTFYLSLDSALMLKQATFNGTVFLRCVFDSVLCKRVLQ